MVIDPGSPNGLSVIPTAATGHVTRRLLIGALVLALFLVVGYLFMVLTHWGHDVDNEAYFGRAADGRTVVKIEGEFLASVTVAIFAFGLLLVVLLGALRRTFVVGMIAAVGVGLAVTGTEILKRLLPWEHLVDTDYLLSPGLRQDSYPSGHATIGMSFALALLLLVPHGWRWWASVAAGFGAVAFGLGVVIAGWHRPADSIGGACWSGAVMAIAAAVAIRLCGSLAEDGSGQPRVRSRRKLSMLLSTGLGLLVYLAVVLFALRDNPSLPDADLAFLVYAFLIVVAAVSVPSWFGNVIGRIAWTTPIAVVSKSEPRPG